MSTFSQIIKKNVLQLFLIVIINDKQNSMWVAQETSLSGLEVGADRKIIRIKKFLI